MSAVTTENVTSQELVNGRVYRQSNLVSVYASTKLFPAEATAFIRYHDDFIGQRILDIGCGTGRLAAYLRPITNQYVGVDVSPHMLRHCTRNYPGLEFHEADMRDLSCIDTGSCNAVLAISNVIDAVSHDDRLKVLAEVRRVLNENGLLVFSSHNRNYIHAGAGPQLAYSRNPVTQLRNLIDYGKAHRNHRRFKPLEQEFPEYALINDSGNEFRNLHYYIDRDVQARQLESSGFQLIECLDPQGMVIGPRDDDRDWSSLLYIARRRD